MKVEIDLAINELFRQDSSFIDELKLGAQLLDISRSGIGIKTKTRIPLDFYFDCSIKFDDKDAYFSVVKVIREEEKDDGYVYGCKFIGLAESLSYKIDEYVKFVERAYSRKISNI